MARLGDHAAIDAQLAKLTGLSVPNVGFSVTVGQANAPTFGFRSSVLNYMYPNIIFPPALQQPIINTATVVFRSRWYNMITSDIIVNGFVIPAALADIITNGPTGCEYWTIDNNISYWYSMFDSTEIDHPQIYDRDLLNIINRDWLSENREIFLGKNDETSIPGSMDPKTSVLFGELGQDALLALDYREVGYPPSVSYLKWCGARTMRWVSVTHSIESFLSNLRFTQTTRE